MISVIYMFIIVIAHVHEIKVINIEHELYLEH